MFFTRYRFPRAPLPALAMTLALALATTLAPAAARAALVVDTGTPSNAVGTGWAFNSGHSYAGQFSSLSGLTINSIQGYFSTDAGSVTISLFSNADDGDGGYTPGASLRSTTLATSAGALAWNGASALNWDVGQGTYWVVFTSTYGAASQASMPGLVGAPLSDYALTQGGQWYDAGYVDLNQGLRVDATVLAAPVPEPSQLAMLALGLVCVGAMVRRKQA